MQTPIPARLRQLEPLTEILEAAAMAAAKGAKKIAKSRHKRRGFQSLRPGPATPLWNELASACEAHLTRHGDKVRLGRIIGLPRQRIHQLLVAKTACADAERTLQLMVWLSARRRGQTPA